MHTYDRSADYLNDLKNSDPVSDLLGNARINFVRKVFGIVAAQLCTTALFISFSTFSTAYVKFQAAAPILTLIATLGALISMLSLLLSRSLAKTYPTNYYLLATFTLCESYLVSAVTAYYEPVIVFQAVFLTAAIVTALAVYAFTSKNEITYYMGLIWMLSLGGFFVAFFGIFVRSPILHLLYAWIGTALAGLYLIYDIKAIMGNHATVKVDLDNYVGGALSLYVDIIRVFLKVLEFLGKDNNRNNKNDNKKK